MIFPKPQVGISDTLMFTLPCLESFESWWVLIREWIVTQPILTQPRLPSYTQVDNECTLCFEKRHEFVHCPMCVHEWCTSCERQWAKKDTTCPYCRGAVNQLQQLDRLDRLDLLDIHTLDYGY